MGERDHPRHTEAGEEEALRVSVIVLDSGALTQLSDRSRSARLLLTQLTRADTPIVPSAILVEALTGDGRRDARVNLFLKSCDVIEHLPERLARRAAFLRTKARRGSAVDAIVVAVAEPDGVVLTTDLEDIEALAAYTDAVRVERV